LRQEPSSSKDELAAAIEVFQNEVIAAVTGGGMDAARYKHMCDALQNEFGNKTPRFIRVCPDTRSLFLHMQGEASSYRGVANSSARVLRQY
jgi:hypothetical protein